MDNPSVVVGHLSDEEIKASIESIVSTVDDGAKRMAQKFDDQIKVMEQSFNRLKNLKADFGESSGGSRRSASSNTKQETQAVKEHTQAVKEGAQSYDVLAQAQQKAISPKSAQDSYYTIIKNMRENVALLAMEIKSLPSLSLDKQFDVYMQYERQIEQVRTRISELNAEMQNIGKDPNSSRLVIKQTMDEIAVQQQKIVQLEREQLQATQQIETADRQTLANKQQQYEKERKALSELVVGEREKVTFQKSSLATKKETVGVEEKSAAKIKEEWELEQKLHQEQGKRFEAQNEINRQLEIEKAKTAENLALQERINAVRAAKESGVGKRVRETNELTGAIAGLLGIQEKEVAVVDAESASQHRLTNYLHQLRSAYQRLDSEGMSSSHGKMLADEIQRVSRAVAEMNKQANRPTSLKKALGLDETTLDNIAYKIQQLNAYKMGLKITDPKQLNEMKQVDEAVARLKKGYDDLMGKNSQLMSSNNALARSWNYMKNRLAFYFTVGASTQFVKNLIDIRSQYEMNERALGVLIDSAERGTQIFNELSKMALVSPYTLIELSNAARELTAYDVAARDVVDTTRRMADISAAVGIPMERLTYALGQIKAYGYLNSRDARMFLNAGIPLVKALADHYTELEGRMVSVGDVYDRIKKKAVDYNEVMQVITEMTDEGGRFFDFQAKMADTLKVQLANLTLAWNNMLNEIGKSEQGVLVGGIKGLKELFLQWENINKAIRNVVVTLGLVKAAQLVYYFAVRNSNNAIALHNVLGNKMSRNLKEIAVGFRNAKNAITGASVAMKSFVLTTIAIAAITTAVVELSMAWIDAEEGVKNFNKTIRDGAAENYKNITNTLEQYKDLRESLYKEEEHGGNKVRVSQDIDESNAKKAWEEMREEIELSSAASETYISRLIQIDNVSERLRQGFVLLDDLQAVNSALSEMGDKTIFIQQDWSSWWNLWLAPDSFEENLRDFIKAKKQIEDAYGDIETAREKLEKASSVNKNDSNLKSGVSRYDQTLEQFRENLKETTGSLIDFISLKGWTGDTNKINELFAQFTNKTVTQLGLDPSEAFTFQLEIEQARAKAAKQSLQIRLEDEKQALKAARDEETKEAIQANIDRLQTELNDFDENNGRGRVLWENYTKWMKEQHMSEMTQMFRDMDEEDIKSINFQEGKWKEFAERTAMQYAKEHKISYNDAFNLLQNWVKNANKWSIFIPLTISTESGKSVYEQLGEYDKLIDDADSQIKRLTTRIRELQAKQKLSKEETKELANAQKELAQAERDKADAEARGGHGKQKAKDAKSAAKAQQQAETELQKALKDELQLLDKVRSQYKKLTDSGVDSSQALTMVTNQFTNSIQRINNVLGKNGLPLFNIKAFAGTENPNAVLEMLKKQLDAAKVAKNIKPEEIKELEVKYSEIVVDAKVYNTKKITDGLNNELSKLKDEYELALELDADPILGEVFKEMFNIDPSGFPNSIDDYMDKVQGLFDSERVKNGYTQTLDVFKASEQDWKDWAESVGISEEALKSFSGKFIEAQDVAKKWATDIVNNTKKLEYDLAELNDKIAIKKKEQIRLHEQIEKEKNEITRHYLELTYQNNQKAIDDLKSQALSRMPEYARVFNSIAEHSTGVARRLQRDLMKVYDSAIFDSASNSWTLTSSNGTQTKLSDTQYRKEREKLTNEMRKSQSNFKKIKEAFKPSDKDGVVDYAKGIELIAEEAKKAADGLHTVADIVTTLGGSEDAVETINDIATSMEGVGTAMQGYAKIQSGDVIGGAADMIKGTWSAVSTWLDNGNKKIDREIKKSENAVKDLELAYKNLERAVEKAYGTAVIGAQKVAIANKEAQLTEVKRQLKLEESRDSKHRDENRIRELRAEIIDIENEIADKTDQIVNDLLGISSVGDAMESLMDGFVEALRSGEDAMKVFDESVDDMIANMVKKMFTTKILTPWFEQQWETIQQEIDKRGTEKAKDIAFLKEKASSFSLTGDRSVFVDVENDELSKRVRDQLVKNGVSFKQWGGRWANEGDVRQAYEDLIRDANNSLIQATTPTAEDIEKFAELLRSGQPIMEGSIDEIKELLVRLGLMKDSANKNLSALQQGIQGVTENTAGAIEAYMNSVSQQVYLHSDLLVQIRDAVVAMDSDAQLGVQAQMLLQLQQSYAIQVAIQGILAGWSNPSGLAVRVEMV